MPRAKKVEPEETQPIAGNDLAAAIKALADATQFQARENSAQERAKEMAKAMHPQNTRHPGISTKNYQGDKDYPRPTLRFSKAFIPWEARESDFSWEELELLNLMEAGEYRVQRHDGTSVSIDVKITKNDITGKEEEIWFLSPYAYSAENRLLLPTFTDQLRQMLGDKAKDVMPMAVQKAKVDAGELPVSVGE